MLLDGNHLCKQMKGFYSTKSYNPIWKLQRKRDTETEDELPRQSERGREWEREREREREREGKIENEKW